MPFGTIVSQTKNYQPRSPGIYSLDTVLFGQPLDDYRLIGGRKGRDGLIRCSADRYSEQDIVMGTDTSRESASVRLSIITPQNGFSAAYLASRITDLHSFLTANSGANLSRLLGSEI